MLIQPREVRLKCGTSIILKSPEVEDAERLLKHLRIVFREAYRNMNQPPDHFDKITIEEEAKILADFTTSQSKFMISAFHDKEIVGNLGCFGSLGAFLKHTARIGMDVDKKLRGKGLGEALLKYAIVSSQKNGFQRLELTVRTFNMPGIGLYEKVGFERVGTLKKVAYIDNEYHDEHLYQLIF